MAHIVPRESLRLDCSEYVGQRGTGQGVFKMVLRPAKVDPRFSTQFWCPKNSYYNQYMHIQKFISLILHSE